MIRVLSLFSGIGAFETALNRVGQDYELVNYCEIDKYASKAYAMLHDVSEDLNLGDITQVDAESLPKDIDLLTHGSPCFLAGELVNTIDGFKNIEDLKVGDVVRSHDGSYNKVIEVMKNQNNFIYDIKCGAVHNINTTFNHPFYVLRDGVKQWVDAKDLSINDFMIIPINKEHNEVKWDGTELCYNRHHKIINNLPFYDMKFWYLIGRFIGDGWVTRRRDRNNNISGIKICCGKHELEDLKSKIGDVFNYCIVEERTVYKLQIVNKELGEFCSQFGIGAINKQIPQNILDLKNEYLFPLLEGILDSDGHFDGATYKVTSISKKLVYNIGELVLKLYKIPYHIIKINTPDCYYIEGRKVNQKDNYVITWNLNDNYIKTINFVDNDYLYSRIRRISNRIELSDVYNIEVENTHSYCVNNIATHNCQSFSVAGRQAGGDEGSGTQSSLMWYSVNIIDKIHPKIVIWENVKNVLGKQHKHNFDKYISTLESFGYNSYYKVLNAKNHGLPQNRERIFVISVRKDIDTKLFEFPESIPLTLRLKDMLEDKVDEKYYLKDTKDFFIRNSFDMEAKGNGFRFNPHVKKNANIAKTITTKAGSRMDDNFVVDIDSDQDTFKFDSTNEELKAIRLGGIFDTEKSKHQAGSVWDTEGLSPTIDTCLGGYRQPCIIDDLYANRDARVYEEYSPALRAERSGLKTIDSELRVRKLTPRECWRLQGFLDEEFDKVVGISNTQLYKMCGNSIAVNVLSEIYKKLFKAVKLVNEE